MWSSADNHAGTNETSLAMASQTITQVRFLRYRCFTASSTDRCGKSSGRSRQNHRGLGASRAGPDLRHLAQATGLGPASGTLGSHGCSGAGIKGCRRSDARAHVRISVELIGASHVSGRYGSKPILQSLSFLRHLPGREGMKPIDNPAFPPRYPGCVA